MSAETFGPPPTLRARARGVLCRACDDGLLDKTLVKWVADPSEEQVADALPDPGADAVDTETGVNSVALNSERPANASESTASKQKRKKKDRGRSLAAALALGDQQADPDFEPTPEQRRCSVPVEKPSSPVAKSSVKSRRATIGDPRDVAGERARILAEREQETQRRAEEKQKRKFAEAIRQAKKLEEKKALHQKRVEYIENKLKTLLECLVAQVSAKAARPQNAVPLMIEVLTEITGKPVTAFKDVSPADRIRREIDELKEEIAKYQEMYDNGDRFTAGSDDEAELPDELDVTLDAG